jgi:hypothetical protein
LFRTGITASVALPKTRFTASAARTATITVDLGDRLEVRVALR